nr:labda-7,13(E)-dien-15-yl diphosphate synthase 1 [Cistus creticus subsp. creticus]
MLPSTSSSSLHFFLPPPPHHSYTTTNHHLIHFPSPPGIWRGRAKDKTRGNRRRCSATSKSRVQVAGEYANVPIVDDEINGAVDFEIPVKDRVDAVKSMLSSIDDGEVTASAYDAAWLALVKDVNGGNGPQFPSCLRWIVENQLPDGSWGDGEIFLAHDRLINTLACVVALKSWNIHPDKCEKGLNFFKENISKLEKENEQRMPIGFEVAFPSLLEVARRLNMIDICYDSPIFETINARRNLKLTKIPKDILHNETATLLYSLEGMGMAGLDWEKLLKLKCKDGSFFSSPSSTAFALMETKDADCLNYLNNMVQKFNGGVPNTYPLDMFERIWVVDRLQRLGISRYFQKEIKDCVDYVYRHWSSEHGICWAGNIDVYDTDDTAMGFRILRLHGYNVSAEVFNQFEKMGEFFSFPGQANESVTGILNLYRAAQVMFPGEKILDKAKQFAFKFLCKKQAANELLDKWIIMKDLPDEVGYGLKMPWYASLPRVESRFYIEQYGGGNDVWIGKTLYRMPYVNNNDYLELAKLDFNGCQALHRMEWNTMQKWFTENKFDDFGMSRRTLLVTYFVAASSIFEPERSWERLAWTKTVFMVEAIGSYFENEMNSEDQRRAFVQEYKNMNLSPSHISGVSRRMTKRNLISVLETTLNHLSLDAIVAYGRDISTPLRHSWEKWMMMWEEEGDKYKGAAELIVKTINLSSGQDNAILSHPKYQKLMNLANTICHQLGHYQTQKGHDNNGSSMAGFLDGNVKVETDMQELVQLVLENTSDDGDKRLEETFFGVARSFYYAAYCDLGTINFHIAKVLFERVD